MIKFYALGLILGVLGLLVWVILRTLAVNVPTWSSIDPENRFGVLGRRVVAALVGFGMAGMVFPILILLMIFALLAPAARAAEGELAKIIERECLPPLRPGRYRPRSPPQWLAVPPRRGTQAG